jgi:hypothetical protein
MRAGGRSVTVVRLTITDAGRRALAVTRFRGQEAARAALGNASARAGLLPEVRIDRLRHTPAGFDLSPPTKYALRGTFKFH